MYGAGAWDVPPGVSAAIAVPAAAGIPVTHRGLASSFAVVTGHEDPAKTESAVDWERLATSVDTLIILMGVGALPSITARLMSAGRGADTPAAVIHSGTTDEEETVVGTLRDIASRAAGIAAPAVIVVGAAVGLRSRLNSGSSTWLPLIAEHTVRRPGG